MCHLCHGVGTLVWPGLRTERDHWLDLTYSFEPWVSHCTKCSSYPQLEASGRNITAPFILSSVQVDNKWYLHHLLRCRDPTAGCNTSEWQGEVSSCGDWFKRQWRRMVGVGNTVGSRISDNGLQPAMVMELEERVLMAKPTKRTDCRTMWICEEVAKGNWVEQAYWVYWGLYFRYVV